MYQHKYWLILAIIHTKLPGCYINSAVWCIRIFLLIFVSHLWNVNKLQKQKIISTSI